MGDGKFGAAYAQEDGVAFKEESSGNNERIGQYSYIDENGNTIVVKYSAGVNGFRWTFTLTGVINISTRLTTTSFKYFLVIGKVGKKYMKNVHTFEVIFILLKIVFIIL